MVRKPIPPMTQDHEGREPVHPELVPPPHQDLPLDGPSRHENPPHGQEGRGQEGDPLAEAMPQPPQGQDQDPGQDREEEDRSRQEGRSEGRGLDHGSPPHH